MKPIAVVNLANLASGEDIEHLAAEGYAVVGTNAGPSVTVVGCDRRERIATAVFASEWLRTRPVSRSVGIETYAQEAVRLADTLIAELDK